MVDKMKVEIWSDIACPFCHIGKKHFEKALEQFPNRDQVEIEWKSFQLDPNAMINQELSASEMLAKKYGMSVDEAKKMNERMRLMAKQSGLDFHLEDIKLTNTFDAHRLIHLAHKHGLQDKAKEVLFTAYLSQGKHIGNHETLIKLGTDIGLNVDDVKQMLNSDQYADAVRDEINEAHRLGVNGVPFFLIDKKYGVSGAQPTENFLNALNDIWKENHASINIIESPDGVVCTPDGICNI